MKVTPVRPAHPKPPFHFARGMADEILIMMRHVAGMDGAGARRR